MTTPTGDSPSRRRRGLKSSRFMRAGAARRPTGSCGRKCGRRWRARCPWAALDPLRSPFRARGRRPRDAQTNTQPQNPKTKHRRVVSTGSVATIGLDLLSMDDSGHSCVAVSMDGSALAAREEAAASAKAAAPSGDWESAARVYERVRRAELSSVGPMGRREGESRPRRGAPRGYSEETWTFGRGCDVAIPWRRVAATL